MGSKLTLREQKRSKIPIPAS